jgi:hypothetical protein
MSFEVLTVVKMFVLVFAVVKPRAPVGIYRCLRSLNTETGCSYGTLGSTKCTRRFKAASKTVIEVYDLHLFDVARFCHAFMSIVPINQRSVRHVGGC